MMIIKCHSSLVKSKSLSQPFIFVLKACRSLNATFAKTTVVFLVPFINFGKFSYSFTLLSYHRSLPLTFCKVSMNYELLWLIHQTY